MSTLTTCSWCEHLNPVDEETCAECGHDAQRPRMLCECWRCAGIPPAHEPDPGFELPNVPGCPGTVL